MAKGGNGNTKNLYNKNQGYNIKNNLSLFLLVLLGVHFDGPLQGFVLEVHFWGVTFGGHLGGPFLKKRFKEQVHERGPQKRSTEGVHGSLHISVING